MDIQLENNNDVIEKVTWYFVITRQLEEINQFWKGLKELNVLQNLKLFKDETIKEFIVSTNKFTSEMLQEIFKEVKYNECEEKRKKEQDIIYSWISVLDEVESGLANKFIQIDIMTGVEKEGNVKIKLEDVLFFLTGSSWAVISATELSYSITKQKKEDELKVELTYIPLNFRLTGDTVATNSAEISLKTSYSFWDSDKNRFSLCYERLTRIL